MGSLRLALLAGPKVGALLVLALAGQGGGGWWQRCLSARLGPAGGNLAVPVLCCADRCWVAEVKHQRSRKTLASLRCDCERLFGRVGSSGAEVEHSPSCSAIDDADSKPRAIREALEPMLGR